MKTFQYWDNKNGWHDSLIFTCNAIDIATADQLFQADTSLNPIKCSWIGCVITELEKPVDKHQEYLSERGIEILNCMVRAWEENEAPLPGDCSYSEAFEWLDKLGAYRPVLLEQRLGE